MTNKEKYDFIDRVVHLTLSVEDGLLNEHGGEYSGLEEDGIDSNEYYRIITERVINILKKNNNYMQEEPVSEDLEKVVEEIVDPTVLNAYGVKEIANRLRRTMIEPVSKDLEEVIDNYLPTVFSKDMDGGEPRFTTWFKALRKTAIHFANWQTEQFEKNRLSHCDAQTEEEAEIESDFVMGIIENEHRQPTFDDAIKYGMRLKEKEMQSTIELAEDHAYFAGRTKTMDETKEALLSEVLPCFMHGGEADEVVAKLDEVLNKKK